MEAELRSVILATNSSLDALRDAHELLKKNHARALEKLSAAEQRAIDAEARREQVQAECRAIYQEWSNQLANQAQEFKSLESQMVPQHIVQMEKINLGNELRSKFEKETKSLRETIETTRMELNNSKKESQNFRIQWENAASEKDLLQARSSKTIAILQGEVNAQKGYNQELESANSQLNDNIRLLESRIIELSVSESHLKLAEAEVRQDADEAARSRYQLEQSHLRTVKELESQCCLLQAQLECHQTQAQEANALKEQALHNLKQSETKNMQYRAQIVELQQNLEEIRSQFDAQTRALQKDLAIAHQRFEAMESQFEARCEDYQNRINNQEKSEQLLRSLHDKREKERERQYKEELEHTKSQLTQLHHEGRKLWI